MNKLSYYKTNPNPIWPVHPDNSIRLATLNKRLTAVKLWNEYQDIKNKMAYTNHPLFQPRTIYLKNELSSLFLDTLPALDEIKGVTDSPFEEILQYDTQMTLLLKNYKEIVSKFPIVSRLNNENLYAQKNMFQTANQIRSMLIRDFQTFLDYGSSNPIEG